MRRLLFLATIVAAVFTLINCNNYKKLTSQTEVLFRNKWSLAEIQGQQVPDSVKSSFEFTPNRISGSVGCNWLTAGFLAGKHQTVTIVPDTLAKKDCGNQNAAALEPIILDALAKSTKWDINGSDLWLGDGNVTLIKLRPL